MNGGVEMLDMMFKICQVFCVLKSRPGVRYGNHSGCDSGGHALHDFCRRTLAPSALTPHLSPGCGFVISLVRLPHSAPSHDLSALQAPKKLLGHFFRAPRGFHKLSQSSICRPCQLPRSSLNASSDVLGHPKLPKS